MKSNEDSYNKVISFIRDEILGEDERELQLARTTLLEEDLGVSGIDAEKFILKFAQRFNVDIQFFNIDDYFEPEFSFFKFRKKQRKGLTIQMLENAIMEGFLK